jgi:hypothetical protein
MLRIRNIALAAAIAFPSAAFAQQPKTVQTGVGGGGSPHVTSTWTLDGATVSISYGRPSLKGRDEAKMMPIGQPWRTGADEATVITSDKPITLGTIKLHAGSYTINTEPGASEWQLIIGKLEKPGQWGVPYQSKLEISRTPMKLGKTSAPVEQVTYHIDTAGKSHTLRIEWGTKSVTVPLVVGN